MKPALLFLRFLLPFLPACTDAVLHPVTTPNAPAAIGPYSQGIVADGFLYTSGQIALRPDGTLDPGDTRAQTRQVLANLDAVLQAAGCGRTDVVKASVFLADLADFAAMNEVYGEFFGAHKPARSTIQAARLPRDARVEIDFIARLPH
ncbi:MAG: RidA family protein [Planctomycetota bacterium]|nr:MAG: RidA family protein [Planctomycetota bacterium]